MSTKCTMYMYIQTLKDFGIVTESTSTDEQDDDYSGGVLSTQMYFLGRG